MALWGDSLSPDLATGWQAEQGRQKELQLRLVLDTLKRVQAGSNSEMR